MAFFSDVTARITGEFSQDEESKGMPQGGDFALAVGLCDYVLAVIKNTNALLAQRFDARDKVVGAYSKLPWHLKIIAWFQMKVKKVV